MVRLLSGKLLCYLSKVAQLFFLEDLEYYLSVFDTQEIASS